MPCSSCLSPHPISQYCPGQPLFSSNVTPSNRRIGRRVRRTNTYDEHGFHPWSEYHLTPIDINTFRTRRVPSLDLVDEIGTVSTQPIDLGLRYTFRDPATMDTKYLFVRDTELRWTEIIAGCRSGIVPERYIPEIDNKGVIHGPMTREWFIEMVSEFTVNAAGDLFRGGLTVAKVWDDFEWKALVMLPMVMGSSYHPQAYTPRTLRELIQQSFGSWHLDSWVW
ncbi:hypothetical protein F5890DRAFT_1559127 [Lentinula detonsa]|uniref:Uncharacterized protein n=1 Tax=Lentinula detonsa TaxID=2804962 RepID=A0AA38PP96_9AGAR|nr:hypothetical protein F5890DRAFT_1559127 [Lentinula detonsa]